jgi:small subunit ribosomal protein S20
VANLKSSKKDIRKAEKRRIRNKAQKTYLRTLKKKINKFLEEGKLEEAKQTFRIYCRYLDRASRKKLIHRRQADRRKSRTAIAINKKEKELAQTK